EMARERAAGLAGSLPRSAFPNRVEELIDQVAADRFANLERADSRGLEGEWSGPFVRGGGCDVWLVLQRSRSRDGLALSNSPAGLAAGRVWAPWLRNHFQTALEYQYLARRATLDGGVVDPVHLVHLNLRYAPAQSPVRISLRVTN